MRAPAATVYEAIFQMPLDGFFGDAHAACDFTPREAFHFLHHHRLAATLRQLRDAFGQQGELLVRVEDLLDLRALI